MIDARRYAKLGGTRAEQTASIGSDFASVTGKQTNSSTPELRLGIDPEGGVQSAPRDFFHSCAARGSPSHEARGTRGRADYTWRGLSSATRLLDYSRWPTMQRPPTLPRMSGFEPNPSIRALLEIPISSLATIFTIPTILSFHLSSRHRFVRP